MVESTSTIKIFQQIESRIRQINVYPLTPENLIIQQDAYKRLAGNDEESGDEVFAVLEQARKESDTDLRFMVQFIDGVFLLSIEGHADHQFRFADLGKTAKEVADQIVATLIMLSNGQLSILHTSRHGKLCAIEIIYRENRGSAPKCFGIDANYSKYIRNDDPTAYESHVLANSFAISPINLPKKYFFRAHQTTGKPLDMPRVFEGNTLSPLTRTEYKAIIKEVGNELAGATSDKDFENKVKESWVLWTVFASIAIPAILFLPENLFPYVGPFVGLGAYLLGALATGYYLRYIESAKTEQSKKKVLKFDEFTRTENLLPIFSTVAVLFVIVTFIFPIYVTKADHRLVNFYQLAPQLPAATLIPALLLLPALVLGLARQKLLRIIAAIASIIAVVGMFVVNFAFTYTGEDIPTPEPQSTMTILAYFAVIAIAITTLVKSGNQKPKANRQ